VETAIASKFTAVAKDAHIGHLYVLRDDGISCTKISSGGSEKQYSLPDFYWDVASITKVFCAQALAKAVVDNRFGLDFSLGEGVAELSNYPEVGGITAQMLATHSSGLPTLPSNLPPWSRIEEIYSGYTTDLLFNYFRNWKRNGAPRFSYSNLGFGVLGLLLERKLNASLEEILREAIQERELCVKLGSTHNTIQGYDRFGAPKSSVQNLVLSGAGGCKISTKAILGFTDKLRNLLQSDASFNLVSKKWLQLESPYKWMGLGWNIVRVGGEWINFHDGYHPGFYSYVGIRPRDRSAVVYLSNVGRSFSNHLLRITAGGGLDVLDPIIDLNRGEFLLENSNLKGIKVNIKQDCCILKLSGREIVLKKAYKNLFQDEEQNIELEIFYNNNGECTGAFLFKEGILSKLTQTKP